MLRIVRHALYITLFILFAGCSGGGCSSGCTTCGITPLPGGFPPEKRIENAAAVRLTDTGVQFLQDNVGTLAATLLGSGAEGGILQFEIPPSSGDLFLGATYDVCPDGPNPATMECIAEIDLGNAVLQITTQGPHNIRIVGDIPIRLQNLPVDVNTFGTSNLNITASENNNCPDDNPGPDFKMVGVDIDIAIEIDENMNHIRYGYSKVRIADFSVSENDIEDGIQVCGGFTAAIFNALLPLISGQLIDPLVGTLSSAIDEQLCQQANPDVSPPCPTGTNDVEGICRYGSTPEDECVAIALGTDGNADLGGLLASFAPGVQGGLDFLLAAGGQSLRPDGSGEAFGDLNPIASGATLGMFGGTEPAPLSNCVALSEMALPTGIPIPEELMGNSVDGWPAGTPGPHLGLALSERFANYAFNGMYNSGLLCIGVGSDTLGDLLSSGTFGILAASLKDLGLQREPQPIAIVIRPGEPPTVQFGNGTNIETDPLLTIGLNRASFDFYIWSLDRYIRFMTATYDLTVPLNLEVTPEGLLPVIETIGVENGSVTNNKLLQEDPNILANAIAELVAGQVGSALGGGLSPIDLNSSLESLGLRLEIPNSVEGQGSAGLRKLTSGDDDFLGIFAAFGIAPPVQMAVDTEVEVTAVEVDEEGLRAATMTKDNGPVVELLVNSPGDWGQSVIEYQYRIDGGPWRPFKRDRVITVRDPWLRLQGKHVIEVRARDASDAYSLDPTPAIAEVLIDVEAPEFTVSAVDDTDTLTINTIDAVSGDAHNLVRYRIDGGAFSEWISSDAIGRIAIGEYEMDIDVEVQDEAGNIATGQQAIIRGKPAASGDGCGCSIPGSDQSNGGSRGSWSFALFLLAMAAGAGRWFSRLRAGNSATGNSATGNSNSSIGNGAARASANRVLTNRINPIVGRPRREALTAFVVLGIAGSFSGCSCGDDETPTDNYACNDPCKALNPGLIGAYTSSAMAGDQLWVAGYLEADWANGAQYGDLVVGRYVDGAVEWEIVDGVPDEPKPDGAAYDLGGFRGGQTNPGEDVGLWTSLAINGDGNPAVAYYDRTNKALKYARLNDGAWEVVTVDDGEGSDIGRYAKLQFVAGQPNIVYQVIEPSGAGYLTSRVRLAVGNQGNWATEDIAINETTPCRAAFCTGGTKCVEASGTCVAEISGCGDCGDACVDIGNGPSCEPILATTKLETYPDAIGGYISTFARPDGSLIVAFYDRVNGNVEVARKEGQAWTRLIVDGQAADGTDTGDVGIGLSLYVDDAGDYHLAYVEGRDETLRYARVTEGTTVAGYQVVDDGLSVNGTAFADGKHIVGDDTTIKVTPSGEIQISYQDASVGTLRYATGNTAGDGGWNVREIADDRFSGAFSDIQVIGGAVQLLHWWRTGGQAIEGNVAIVSP